MYSVNKELTHLDPTRGQVVHALSSLSSILVAAAELPAEQTQAYACTVLHHNGNYTVYIGLHLTRSDKKVIYVPDPPETDEAGLAGMEEEARGFMESMGFIVDPIDLKSKPIEEQIHWVETCPIFRPPAEVEVELTQPVPEPAESPAAEPESAPAAEAAPPEKPAEPAHTEAPRGEAPAKDPATLRSLIQLVRWL